MKSRPTTFKSSSWLSGGHLKDTRYWCLLQVQNCLYVGEYIYILVNPVSSGRCSCRRCSEPSGGPEWAILNVNNDNPQIELCANKRKNWIKPFVITCFNNSKACHHTAAVTKSTACFTLTASLLWICTNILDWVSNISSMNKLFVFRTVSKSQKFYKKKTLLTESEEMSEPIQSNWNIYLN